MKIEVNNGCTVEIKRGSGASAIVVTHRDEYGEVERRDGYSENELISVLNLLDYMRRSGEKSAYILEDFALKILNESGGIDYAEEFKIFQ